jgi:hypothetical protein
MKTGAPIVETTMRALDFASTRVRRAITVPTRSRRFTISSF